MKKGRKYLTSAGATFAVVALSAVAFAAPSLLKAQHPTGSDDEVATVNSSHSDNDSNEPQNESTPGPNHGHCVSYWAHQAKDLGIEGSARGEFISSVAGDSTLVSDKVTGTATPTGTCASVQPPTPSAATTSHGESGEKHGKSGESHGQNQTHPSSGS